MRVAPDRRAVPGPESVGSPVLGWGRANLTTLSSAKHLTYGARTARYVPLAESTLWNWPCTYLGILCPAGCPHFAAGSPRLARGARTPLSRYVRRLLLGAARLRTPPPAAPGRRYRRSGRRRRPAGRRRSRPAAGPFGPRGRKPLPQATWPSPARRPCSRRLLPGRPPIGAAGRADWRRRRRHLCRK